MIRINTSNERLHERPIGKHVKVLDAMSDWDTRVPLRGRGHDSRAASVPVSTTRRSVPQISPHKTRRTLHRERMGATWTCVGSSRQKRKPKLGRERAPRQVLRALRRHESTSENTGGTFQNIQGRVTIVSGTGEQSRAV